MTRPFLPTCDIIILKWRGESGLATRGYPTISMGRLTLATLMKKPTMSALSLRLRSSSTSLSTQKHIYNKHTTSRPQADHKRQSPHCCRHNLLYRTEVRTPHVMSRGTCGVCEYMLYVAYKMHHTSPVNTIIHQ